MEDIEAIKKQYLDHQFAARTFTVEGEKISRVCARVRRDLGALHRPDR